MGETWARFLLNCGLGKKMYKHTLDNNREQEDVLINVVYVQTLIEKSQFNAPFSAALRSLFISQV